QIVQARIVQAREDQQHAVGAKHSGLVDLVAVDDGVLAQHRQRARLARLPQVVVGALEEVDVGEHRETGCAAGLVAARDRRGIEVLADHALRRAGLLDLGDHRGVPGGDLRFKRGREAAHRRRVGQAHENFGTRHVQLALGDLFKLARKDAREHIRRPDRAHAWLPSAGPRASIAAVAAPTVEPAGAAQAPVGAAMVAIAPLPSARVAATNSSSFAFAAPDAMVACASSTPPAIESATPATYSAAPALSDTIRPGRPSASLIASSTMAFDSSAPSTFRLRLAAIGMPKSPRWISY